MTRFNLNHDVRIKLTDRGRAILAGLRDSPINPKEPDADGWHRAQLWIVMAVFGPHLDNGPNTPFETEIELIEPRL